MQKPGPFPAPGFLFSKAPEPAELKVSINLL